ncbi:hypothetical protein WR25_11238 [Diploscapter pachys]|uniref:Uncharacterized protein n=1 Tax=Diploscapter pachys TaxID=2018661 RepID=A0A2A2KD66_9BILA|nr:hypothetical protein WR25_11238 [Diploscapter pachys]
MPPAAMQRAIVEQCAAANADRVGPSPFVKAAVGQRLQHLGHAKTSAVFKQHHALALSRHVREQAGDPAFGQSAQQADGEGARAVGFFEEGQGEDDHRPGIGAEAQQRLAAAAPVVMVDARRHAARR